MWENEVSKNLAFCIASKGTPWEGRKELSRAVKKAKEQGQEAGTEYLAKTLESLIRGDDPTRGLKYFPFYRDVMGSILDSIDYMGVARSCLEAERLSDPLEDEPRPFAERDTRLLERYLLADGDDEPWRFRRYLRDQAEEIAAGEDSESEKAEEMGQYIRDVVKEDDPSPVPGEGFFFYRLVLQDRLDSIDYKRLGKAFLDHFV